MKEVASRHQGKGRASWLVRIVPSILIMGFCCLAFAQLAPELWLRTEGWSEEQAHKHQEVSAELHKLTFANQSDPQVQQRLRESRLQFAEMESALSSASSSANRTRNLLRWTGAILCGLGIVGGLAIRSGN